MCIWTLSWKEQLKPLLHLSFRLWFFRSVFEETFNVNESGETKRHTKTHRTDYRKKNVFFSLASKRWRWDEDVPKKKSYKARTNKHTEKEKKTQRATQTNTKQCWQREKKIPNTNASKRAKTPYTKGQKRGKQVTFLFRTNTTLISVFVLKAKKFSANTQNILLSHFFVCVATCRRFFSIFLRRDSRLAFKKHFFRQFLWFFAMQFSHRHTS